MTYTFLLLDLFLLFIPFCLLLDHRKIGFSQLVSAIIPAFLVTIIFTEMAIFWANLKVLTFNNAYLLGPYYRWLPVEFYLFTFAFTFTGLCLYFYLNAKFPSNHLQKYSLALSNIVLGLCIAFLFFAYTKWYSVLIFGVLFLLLAFIEYKNELRFMYRFYRAFALCLLLFFVCYGILCNLPVLSYKEDETVGFSLFKIPFENYFLVMAMLLFGVYVSEFIKSRRVK
jgi:hypothetical protein